MLGFVGSGGRESDPDGGESCRGERWPSSSGSARVNSNPRIELGRIRSGLTRRTASMRGEAGMGATGRGALSTAGGPKGTASPGLSTDFFALNAASTRRVISSTIASIDASNATVTAARTCSPSTTATNGIDAGAGADVLAAAGAFPAAARAAAA